MKVGVVGGSGGIGSALIDLLLESNSVSEVRATHHRDLSAAGDNQADTTTGPNLTWSRLDATDEQSVANWLEELGAIDWLVNCVGMLHTADAKPEKSIRQFNPELFQKSMAVNCLPTLLLAKYAHAALNSSDNPLLVTVSARVGSIEDNGLGGWHSYRASKAALNMALKCIAIEWERTLPKARVLSFHPGTTDTALSKPFQKRVPEGKLFDPAKTANYLLIEMQRAHQFDSGRFIAWDGSTIPW